MPAPKGNKFWKQRSKHGRDSIFAEPEIMLEAAYAYFDWNAKNPWMKNEAIKSGENAGKIIRVPTERPLTLEGLTSFWDTNTRYLEQFERNLQNKELPYAEDFSTVITHIREIIRRQKLEGATIGAFNHNIVARELGLLDRQSHEITGKDGAPLFDTSKLSDDEVEKLLELLDKTGE